MEWKNRFPQEDRFLETDRGILFNGDALEILKQFPDNSVDTVITDPPYGLSKHSERIIRKTLSEWLNGNESFAPNGKGFMAKEWDAFVPPPAVWREVYRVVKPGAILLVFAGTRSWDLMALSLRLAGFEIKDTLMWLYGSGFPKSLDIGKAVDKKLGNKREVISRNPNSRENCDKSNTLYRSGTVGKTAYITKGFTEWEGYGTALKPAWEPIIMAMKPLDGTYAENALKWGVAGLNIDGGRIPFEETQNPATNPKYRLESGYKLPARGQKSNGAVNFVSSKNETNIKGRFPANLLLDEESAKMLDKQSGGSKSGAPDDYGDSGGASRFFYIAKASRKERGEYNNHPTVKPLKLIEYLVKLTKMPSEKQIYLDLFLGSGTTAIAVEKLGRNWIGIEKEKKYCEIAKKRIKSVEGNLFAGGKK